MFSPHKHGMIAIAAAGALSLGVAVAQAPSAAPPPTPNPMSAAPVQQTPPPATSAPAAPLTNPGATSPTQNPSATAPVQTPGPVTTMQNPNLAPSPIQMPSSIPSKAETGPSAFDKLAASGSTFVTKAETAKLDGFDRAFSEADRDKDGKLTKDEFDVAWAIYTGRT